MCFALFIGSERALPDIPWKEELMNLNTCEPGGEERSALSEVFSLPYIKHVGSDTICGCGFRSASFQSGAWPEEEHNLESDFDEDYERMHRQLFDFVSPLLKAGEKVELYGCWDGDHSEPVEHKEEIPATRLLERDFFLRERGFYALRP